VSALAEPAKTEPWTVASVLRWATEDFRSRGITSPRLDAELLLGFALGMGRTQLIIELMRPLAPDELGRFRELVKRRRAHEPVAYILGVREFYGRPFRVDRRVLVPRPDTETLVEVALERTRHVSLSMRALDLCTGSGCVAISLARERPTSCVWATDLSEDAIAVARENALRLGAYNVVLRAGDLFAPARGRRFDVVTANPPYIREGEIPGLDADIRAYEPHVALSGGADGLVVIRRIVEDAPSVLAPGGVLAIEVGAGQAREVATLFEGRGFVEVERARDYGRIERVVHGVWRR
jgi:release factor glutamine methyltransferase